MPSRCERFHHDPRAGGAGGRGQAAERLGEGRVPGDLLGRLAQDQAEHVAPAGGELAGRRVRVVAELRCGAEHALAGIVGDLHVGAVVQHEGDRGSRDPGSGSDIGARRTRSSHRHSGLHPRRFGLRQPFAVPCCR